MAGSNTSLTVSTFSSETEFRFDFNDGTIFEPILACVMTTADNAEASVFFSVAGFEVELSVVSFFFYICKICFFL